MSTLKLLAVTAGASVLFASSALADLPKSGEDCFKAADEIADAVEQIQLSEEEADRADDLLIRMEEHCEASEFGQAVEVAEALKTLIAERR